MKQTQFFKRLLSVMLLISMAISALPVARAEVQHGYVLLPSGEKSVNFRRDPNTDDNANYPLARLPGYWVVEILGTEYTGSQKWYRVRTNTGTGAGDPENIQTGYVMADYIRTMSTEEESAYSVMTGSYFRPGENMSNPQRPSNWVAGEHAYVLIPGTSDSREVNFRREPNTDDNVNYPIARLPEYWVVEILGSESRGGQQWYHVQTNIGVGANDPVNYQTGYVMATFIKIMTAEEEAVYSATLGNYFRPDSNYLAENSMRSDFDPNTDVTETIPWIIPTGTVLGYVYIINGDAVIYNEPSGTPIGFSVPNGTLVPYYEVVPFATKDAYEWLRIAYQGNEGYIREGFYKVAGQTSAGASQPSTNTGTAVTGTTGTNTGVIGTVPQPTAYTAPTLVRGQTLGMVTQDNVFFRNDMSTAGDFWARLPYGWTMTVMDVQTKGKITWYKVKGGTPQNPDRTYVGYIHGDYFILINSTVTPTPAPWYVPTGVPTAAPTAVPQGNSRYGLVLVDGVNMRQTPGGATVAALRANTVVIIYSRPANNTANDWYYVKHEGVMGYLPATSLRVLNTYELPNYTLPDGTVVTASPTPEVTPAGVKGYVKLIRDKVNIRKAPDGEILTVTDQSKLPVGMVMPYYEGPSEVINGFTWVKVTNGTITGYIRNDCYSYCDAQGNIIAAPTQAIVTATPVVPGSQGYIKLIKGGVNLRSAPAGETVAQLAKDTVLPYFNVTTTTAASLETWYEVYWAEKGIFGFILSTMAQQCDAQGNIISPVLPTSNPGTNVGYVATSVSGVWLRATPYADGDIVGQVKQKYTVLPQIGPVVKNGYDWYPVQTEDGKRGYLRGDCVFALAQWQLAEYQLTGKVPTPSPGPATPRPGNSSYIITTMDKVYIRQTPSTKATAIGQVSLGSIMKYTATQTIGKGTANEVTWYQVTYAGQVGWMHGSFVRILSNAEYDSMNATPTPQPGTTAVPTTAPNLENLSDMAFTTMDKVNIRASASMSGRDIYMVDKANTEVTYLGKYTVPDPLKNNNYYWFNIRYGNVTGWIRGDCIYVLTEEEKAQRKTPTVVTAPPEGYRTLSLNSTGDEVYSLQYRLYQLGYLARDQVNGTYLATTQAAVRAFQQASGLTADGIAGPLTQQVLYGASSSRVTPAPNNNGGINGQYVAGSSTTVVLYPVEKSDWFDGDIQEVWPNGSVAILTDVYTGISFKAQRLYGGNHADCEPVDTADTAAICAIYGVNRPQEIEDREQELQSYRRRPTWVTVGGRTFCASVYGIPHNYSGDRIANNGYTGQFCVHFTNSRTHTSNIVDPDASYNNYFGAQSAIQYAYEHSISGWK